MIRFEDLLEKVRAYSGPDADLELLRKAYVFSAMEHKGQVRHSGEPYLIHPLEVADFLAEMKLDPVAIAAGLLHDVVEDTLTSIKRLYSINQKLQRQKIELEQVYDFVALRIITSEIKDCYAALGIIHQTWSPVPGRIKDFIAMPRPNGYQSLHTSVISEHGMPFEVQIRTTEMHRMAEEGIAAHWKYKEGRGGDRRDERYFQWMRQLLEYQQEVRDPQEFIQNLKVDLYPEEVYTFTPKGQVKSFPRGATPIDFAYSIHTDVGHQCVGARVNGKMVPLRTHLRNGDIVEIVTQTGHKPSRDWLNVVVTSHARYKIKHLIRS